MRLLIHRIFLLCSLVSFGYGYCAENVSVSFINTDQFTDAENARNATDEPLLGISQYLQSLGRLYLPADQTLKLQVLDVDLAGRERFLGRLNRPVRVVNGKSDWPQIKISYILEKNNRILQRGEEIISDMNYMLHINTFDVNDPLRYEKQMILRWFMTRFGQGAGASPGLKE